MCLLMLNSCLLSRLFHLMFVFLKIRCLFPISMDHSCVLLNPKCVVNQFVGVMRRTG